MTSIKVVGWVECKYSNCVSHMNFFILNMQERHKKFILNHYFPAKAHGFTYRGCENRNNKYIWIVFCKKGLGHIFLINFEQWFFSRPFYKSSVRISTSIKISQRKFVFIFLWNYQQIEYLFCKRLFFFWSIQNAIILKSTLMPQGPQLPLNFYTNEWFIPMFHSYISWVKKYFSYFIFQFFFFSYTNKPFYFTWRD